ncbi:MAG: hypothetical protein KDC84_02770 [Crocinitomicaceae bacterium]|nr:hypothetical protein [Crocinitomicaceae bacterium]
MKFSPNILYKFGIVEFLLIFLFIFFGNNYYLKPDARIVADGEGYYDYLKSTFIFHDIDRKGLSRDSEVFQRLDKYGFYVEYKEGKVNKYTCGTAMLQMPFFLVAYMQEEGEELTGEEDSFQTWAFYGAIFYAFFGLFFLRLAFVQFSIHPLSIFLIQASILFATSYTYELNYGVFGSHVYSFFAIAAFLYFARRYFKELRIGLFYLACLAIGFILIIRQINILILLFIPFIAGDWATLKNGFVHLFRPFWRFFFGLAIIISIGFIQVYFWYQQTGDLLVYSYGSERFFFQYPHIMEMLFSYRRSLFVYAPITIVSILGFTHLLFTRKYFQLISWWIGFLLLTYIFSCWWDWTYGASYGQRVFIDVYPIIFLMIAFYLEFIGKKGAYIFGVVLISASLLNTIQMYQWRKYIIDYHYNTEEKYSKVFLKTAQKYEGLYYQLPDKPEDLVATREFNLGDMNLKDSGEQLAFEILDSTGIEYTQFLCLQFESNFAEESNAEITITIEDLTTGENLFWAKRPIIHFAKLDFNTLHEGYYLFGMDIQPIPHQIQYRIFVKTDEYFYKAEKLKLSAMRKP